jgi:hydrogenase maturation protease
MPKILVACVGNIFLGDDAFGVEVAKRLRERELPDDVVVSDFGIRGYDLAYALMEEWSLVILVDALPRGGPPGTVYTLEPELPVQRNDSCAPDAHSLNPDSVLQLVHALEGRPRRMLVVGCEPEHIEPDAEGKIGLSPPVDAGANEAVKIIEELINRARCEVNAA